MRRFRLKTLGVPIALAACHLVDQRDFNAAAGRPPKPPAVTAQPAPAVPALMTIGFAQPNPSYQADLTGLVHQALARKPDARFTVITALPPASSAATTADEAAAAAADGRAVAQTIVDAGAAPAQVEQQVAAASNVGAPQVRVLVR